MVLIMVMTRRVLDGFFENPGDLPLVVSGLPVTGVARRFVASSATNAVGTPVLNLPTRGSRAGDLAAVGASTAPILRNTGGRVYLEFDGVDDVLTCSTSDATIGTAPFTTYAVGRYRSAVPAGAYWPITDHGGAGGGGFGITANGGNMLLYRDGLYVTPTAVDTNWHVFIGVFNGVSSVFKRDLGANQTGNAGAAAITTLRIGSSPSAAKPAIDVAEQGMFDRALTATEMSDLAASLVSDYSIV
jgi:hypothetical protein